MRLIDTQTLQFAANGQKFPYAILSHTWGKDEVTFQDFNQPDKARAKQKKGYAKIAGCCAQAVRDGIKWAWIDTCCIDKTNSAELSEAINSMYAWYKNSAVCYVYLQDVEPRSSLTLSRWFTRGWCLQELIAPTHIEFYARDWSELGTKWQLYYSISEITGLPHKLLLPEREIYHGLPWASLKQYSVAQRLSWASMRGTTRIEDLAYCLFGIFDIHMPLVYGEGKKAFIRLQNEVLSQEEDYSFLLWKSTSSYNVAPILAESPRNFHVRGFMTSTGQHCRYDDLQLSKHSAQRSPPQPTSRGLKVTMFAQKASNVKQIASTQVAYFLWTEYKYAGMFVCIALAEIKDGSVRTYGGMRGDIIYLFESEDFWVPMELMDLHLATRIDQVTGPVALSNFAANYEPLDLEVKLASRAQTSINFVHVTPKISISTAGPTSACSVSAQPSLNENMTSLYCRDIGSVIPLESPGPTTQLLFQFQLCQNELATSQATTLLLVFVWVKPVYPRCCVTKGGEPDELSDESAVAHLEAHQQIYHEVSDRSNLSYSGNFVWAIVKWSEMPGTFSNDRSVRKPARLTLCVTVETRTE